MTLSDIPGEFEFSRLPCIGLHRSGRQEVQVDSCLYPRMLKRYSISKKAFTCVIYNGSSKQKNPFFCVVIHDSSTPQNTLRNLCLTGQSSMVYDDSHPYNTTSIRPNSLSHILPSNRSNPAVPKSADCSKQVKTADCSLHSSINRLEFAVMEPSPSSVFATRCIADGSRVHATFLHF